MKLIRVGDTGRERPGILTDDGRRIDASALTSDYDQAFFASDGLDRLRMWMAREGSRAPELPAAARLGPPVSRPNKIVCIGLNYRDHAAESGMDIPKEPVFFLKATTALCGANDDIVMPRGGAKLDYEVEFAAIIARTARYVTPQQAITCIAGYALFNDYSERAFQLERGGQWVKGKSADTFAPLGPFLATCDELPDVSRLEMWLDVNGAPRQRGSTTMMIFDVPTLVSYVSHFMTLLPGDVVSTGTPPGVALGMKPSPAYLKAGDQVTLGIEGVGRARQRIISLPDGASV